MSSSLEIKAQAQRDWAQTDTSTVENRWWQVSAAGNTAWVVSEITFKLSVGGQALDLPARLTAILEKRGDRWMTVHSHYSFPAA